MTSSTDLYERNTRLYFREINQETWSGGAICKKVKATWVAANEEGWGCDSFDLASSVNALMIIICYLWTLLKK
jgi:hypothetical protein